jgi:hypothetical protein
MMQKNKTFPYAGEIIEAGFDIKFCGQAVH